MLPKAAWPETLGQVVNPVEAQAPTPQVVEVPAKSSSTEPSQSSSIPLQTVSKVADGMQAAASHKPVPVLQVGVGPEQLVEVQRVTQAVPVQAPLAPLQAVGVVHKSKLVELQVGAAASHHPSTLQVRSATQVPQLTPFVPVPHCFPSQPLNAKSAGAGQALYPVVAAELEGCQLPQVVPGRAER